MQNWQGGPPQGGGPGGYGGQQQQPQQPGYGQQQPQQQQPGGYGQQQPQQPAGGYGQPQQAQQAAMGQAPMQAFGGGGGAAPSAGFGKALFDFSFRTSIGPTVIKIVYGIVCLMAVGTCLMGLYQVYYNLFERYYGEDYVGAFISFLGAIIAPVVTIVVGRLYCELLAAIFRIADNMQEMNDRQRAAGG